MGRLAPVSSDLDPRGIGIELVAAACAAGADDADVFLRDGRLTRLTLQGPHISESTGWQTHLALRVWRAGRCALATSNDASRAGLADLAARTVAAAEGGMRLTPLLAKGDAPHGEDEPLEQPTAADRLAWLEETLAAVGRHPEADAERVTGCYTENLTRTVLVSSRGFAAQYTSPEYRLWLWVESSAGRLVAAGASRRGGDLVAATLAAYERQRTAALDVDTCDVPSGACEVLLPPSVAADLARSLGVLLSADTVLAHFKRLLQYLDRPIAAPAVTLIDDGVLSGGLKSRPIDDEGTPTARTTLIEHGCLRTLLHSRHTAAALGAPPNGKATRPRLWDQPRPTPSAIHFTPGLESPEALSRQVRRGLVVSDALRPGRIQSTTGKFTTVVRGWWVEPGMPRRAVSRVPLAVNIFDLLGAVRACGNDLHFSSLADGAGAPSLLVDRMVVG